MISEPSSRQLHLNYLLRIGLVLALVFAVWHAASHHIDTSHDISGHEECQVCRLSHIPIIDLPILAGFAALLLVSFVRVIPAIQQPGQHYRYSLRARSPPLF